MFTRRLSVYTLPGVARLAAQGSTAAPVSIHVTGAVKQVLMLTAGDLAKIPRVSIHLPRDGRQKIYEGDRAGGKPLVGTEGPFRLVVPQDKPAARSVRMLTRLEVVQVRK